MNGQDSARTIACGKNLGRNVAVFACLLLLASPALAQTHIPFGNTTATLQWGPPPDGIGSEADSQADHYEINQDAGAFVNANVTLGQANYSFLIPQAWKTVGAHTLGVRLCRQAVCGSTAFLAYVQDAAVPSTPGLPTNPRVVVPAGAVGIAVNGVINRLFKEKGLDVAEVTPEGGGQLLVGAAGLRVVGAGYTVRVGDQAGVVVWRPEP